MSRLEGDLNPLLSPQNDRTQVKHFNFVIHENRKSCDPFEGKNSFSS
jgi:hypothetical protein